MRVRQLEDVMGTEDGVDAGDWFSRRLVPRRDGTGHSVHETVFRAGRERRMQYRNHLETVNCVVGKGELEDVRTWTVHPVRPGTVYAQDEHILRAKTDLRLVCVFTPALVGPETHDERDSYPLLDDGGRVLRR